MWTVALERILTIDNLIRLRLRLRLHILVNWCCMCCGDTETVDHLLSHCSVASHLWMAIVALFGLGSTRVDSGGVAKLGWGRVGKRRWKVWLLAGHCLMWLIWLERNKCTFTSMTWSVPWLERHLLTVLHSWIMVSVDPDVLTFVDFIEDLIN